MAIFDRNIFDSNIFDVGLELELYLDATEAQDTAQFELSIVPVAKKDIAKDGGGFKPKYEYARALIKRHGEIKLTGQRITAVYSKVIAEGHIYYEGRVYIKEIDSKMASSEIKPEGHIVVDGNIKFENISNILGIGKMIAQGNIDSEEDEAIITAILLGMNTRRK